MDPALYSTRKGGLPLYELISLLEEDADQRNVNIYIEPPVDHGVDTEEDGDNSDDEHIGDINHLCRGILKQNCEIFQKENNSDDIQESLPEHLLFAQPETHDLSNASTSQSGPKKKKKKLHSWTGAAPDFSANKMFIPKESSLEAKTAQAPVDFFLLFFDENLTSKIVEETNRFAQQKNRDLQFKKDEFFVLLGGMLLSGYGKYPHKRMYWHSTEDVPKMLSNSMRLNRFETLLRHMHFNDNAKIDTTDRLYKIRPLIDALNENFKRYGRLEEALSIDESMIPYYGKHYAKQYIKGKPIRFGYKNWAICNSNGYMINFEIYTGKSDSEKIFGLGGDVVMSLLQKAEVPADNGHKIFFDNYFTSLRLLQHLSENNICATGTVRQDRTEKCPFPDVKFWKDKPRGTCYFMSCENVTFVQWKDNKVVTVATNFESNDIATTSRWCKESKSKKQVTQPKIIANYNKNMGGVDIMDGLIAVYRTRMRQRKWYWPIVSYLLDASVSNAWILMKKLMPSNPNCASLLVFRRYIALSFLQTYGKKPSRGKTTLPYPVASRFDNIGHMTTLTTASQYLFSALDSRAYLRSATVLLPTSWPDSCVATSVLSSSGEVSDITVLPNDPVRGSIWTQQSLGCGQPGDQIYLGYEELLIKNNNLGRKLVREFAKYRFGVFDEDGYYNDPIYPICYLDDQTKQVKVTGCSDLPIKENGICTEKHSVYNLTKMVDEKARSSIMFAPEISSVLMFCDEGNHNRLAPTKHNFFCERRSVLDVIINHKDFSKDSHTSLIGNQITDTTPRIIYKKQNITRYVFVIENSKDMMQRESWSYLRLAMRQWARYVLPDNTEIGMVLSDPTQSIRALNIVPVKVNGYDRFGNNNRDKFYSAIPYTPSESMQKVCLQCAIAEAMNMLKERNKSDGSANNVIVVIATGMTVNDHMKTTIDALKKLKIKVATINYPDVLGANTLNLLSKETGGSDYTVFEEKLNVDTTLLTTYFELHNVLYDIAMKFSSRNQIELPMEIHRKIITDDGRTSITGSFMLEPNMGEPAQFTFYTHNTITPLIKGLKLISPSQQIFTSRNDRLIDFKMITLNSNISETGTWTYIIEPYPGNPQPHFIQVMATPRSVFSPVVRLNFKMHRNIPGGPLLLLAELKYGDLPILGAKVDVMVTKPGSNGSLPLRSKIELLDTGSGDPDVTKGDGVYTRYFSASEWGPGLYNFEVTASDNGNSWFSNSKREGEPCCGSSISSNGVQPLAPFQRSLSKQTIIITAEDISIARQVIAGRIGDVKVQILPEDLKARLSWTSPDMGGDSVSHYEIRYANSVLDIMEKFETKANTWDFGQPFPLSPGSETTFTLDFNQKKDLLDQTLYFAIKSYSKTINNISGPISNWVRVFVSSPPPPPTVPPIHSFNDNSYWPNNANSLDIETAGPSITTSMPIGLELILPVVIGLIILIILLILYFYFCVIKRKHTDNANSLKANAINKDNLNSTITIVSSSPQNNSNSSSQTYVGQDIPDPHQIGLPVNNYGYEDDTKKRYSLVNQQEQQLIEELKHHQQQRDNNYEGVSVISNNSINRNQILSPYNSWSASQLLHEHERRRSPMMDGNMTSQEQIMNHQGLMLNGEQMSNVDHMSLNGHQILDPYSQSHMPPPVPPLPVFGDNRYPPNYDVYDVHPSSMHVHPIYQSMHRREPFNQSLQGSLSSVNSGEKKRRNVTMV